MKKKKRKEKKKRHCQSGILILRVALPQALGQNVLVKMLPMRPWQNALLACVVKTKKKKKWSPTESLYGDQTEFWITKFSSRGQLCRQSFISVFIWDSVKLCLTRWNANVMELEMYDWKCNGIRHAYVREGHLDCRPSLSWPQIVCEIVSHSL